MDKSNSEKRVIFVNGLQISGNEANMIRNKQEHIINDSKKLELYQDFVAVQKEAFKSIMYYFNDMLTELKEKGKISDFVEFRARIKSPESALTNDEKKALNDVFAMEFIGATEKEVDFLLSEINKRTITTKEKNHNKPNGYKAKHRVFAINNETSKEISEKFGVDENSFPLFECQFKTIAVAIEANTGTAKHINYKGLDPKTIQKKYDNGEFRIGYNIPQMWVSRNCQMEKLSSDETLKKLYPFLDLTKKKDKEK